MTTKPLPNVLPRFLQYRLPPVAALPDPPYEVQQRHAAQVLDVQREALARWLAAVISRVHLHGHVDGMVLAAHVLGYEERMNITQANPAAVAALLYEFQLIPSRNPEWLRHVLADWLKLQREADHPPESRSPTLRHAFAVSLAERLAGLNARVPATSPRDERNLYLTDGRVLYRARLVSQNSRTLKVELLDPVEGIGFGGGVLALTWNRLHHRYYIDRLRSA